MAAAAAATAAPTSCRHFTHLLLETEASGRVVVPLLLTLQAEDMEVLGSQLTAVLEDVLFILRLHAPRILPGPGAGSGGGGSGGAAGACAAGAVAVYHGHLVSATFSLREPEPYAVLEAAHDADGGWTNLPLAAFRLCASVRHKASERRRRKERLLTSPRKLDAYLLAGGAKLEAFFGRSGGGGHA